MSNEEADAKSKRWAFHRDGSIVGVVAETEEAAASVLREGSVPPVPLKSTPPLVLESRAGALVALGVVDETTQLLAGYSTHDYSVITLEDPAGARWALRPTPRVIPEAEPAALP